MRLPKALIVPHAGYALLRHGCRPARTDVLGVISGASIRNVVLIGPEPSRADARPRRCRRSTTFETPLGPKCPIDRVAADNGCGNSGSPGFPMQRMPPSIRSRCNCPSCRPLLACLRTPADRHWARCRRTTGGAGARGDLGRALDADRGQLRPQPLPHGRRSPAARCGVRPRTRSSRVEATFRTGRPADRASSQRPDGRSRSRRGAGGRAARPAQLRRYGGRPLAGGRLWKLRTSTWLEPAARRELLLCVAASGHRVRPGFESAGRSTGCTADLPADLLREHARPS